MIKQFFIAGMLLGLVSCQSGKTAPKPDTEAAPVPVAGGADMTETPPLGNVPAADQFMGNLAELCRKSYEGKVISTDPVDADWAKEILTIHVADCRRAQISIPLHVGENRSRTWVFTQTPNGLRLKHDHRHEDGSHDAVTMYGGDTDGPGTAHSQSFPVDAESIALFEKEGLSASVTNVWTVTLIPGETLTYELKRPNRLFQAQFDLTKTVDTPPPAWGHE